MSGLLIKNVPPEIHRKLREDAARNHRSMTRHALALLEAALAGTPAPAGKPPKPVHPAFPVSAKLIRNAIREGRS